MTSHLVILALATALSLSAYPSLAQWPPPFGTLFPNVTQDHISIAGSPFIGEHLPTLPGTYLVGVEETPLRGGHSDLDYNDLVGVLQVSDGSLHWDSLAWISPNPAHSRVGWNGSTFVNGRLELAFGTPSGLVYSGSNQVWISPAFPQLANFTATLPTPTPTHTPKKLTLAPTALAGMWWLPDVTLPFVVVCFLVWLFVYPHPSKNSIPFPTHLDEFKAPPWAYPSNLNPIPPPNPTPIPTPKVETF